MTPFQLQIRPNPEATDQACRWSGPFAIHAEGTLPLPRSTPPLTVPPDQPWLIDRRPLPAEVAAGLIADQDRLQQADEFLPLCDLRA
jgi:hypothetical protein